jgi:peptidoglycan/LPS O-acetylase OafA/YrhL
MVTKNYKSRIDGLRFVAIFMVLLEHFAIFIGRPIYAGFYGVNLFFVISGFLITSILLNDKNYFKKAYVNFLCKRSLRIFPIYYLTLFFLYLCKTPNISERIPYLLSYTYNYHYTYLDFPSEPYSAFWSLSVEEQFYLFFPFIILLLRNKRIIIIGVCLIFFSIASLQLLFNTFNISKYNYMGLLTNMAPLSMGAIGAILQINKAFEKFLNNKSVELAVLFAVILISLLLRMEFKLIIWPFLNLYLVLKAYNFQFQIKILDTFIINPIIVLIGRISYGIYLYHYIIAYYFTLYIFDPIWLNVIPFENFGLFSKIKFHSWVVKFPLYSLLSVVVAYLSYVFIESPFLKLKEKLFPV